MIQIFDSQILMGFVLFQKMLQVEDLPIRKPHYNKIENRVSKVFKYLLVCLFFVVYPACIATLSCYRNKYFYTVMSLQFLIGQNILLLLLLIYIVTGFNLLMNMYKFHRLEYYNHSTRKIAKLLTTFASGFILFFIVLTMFYIGYCNAEAYEIYNYKIKNGFEQAYPNPFYDRGKKDFCSSLIDWNRHNLGQDFRDGKVKLYYFFSVLLELLPFLTFFWLDEPHDCFVCLGKDPDRVYSVF